MNFFARRPWDLPQRQHTPESIYAHRDLHRREFLAAAGITSLLTCAGISGCSRAGEVELVTAGGVKDLPAPETVYPEKRANRNPKFEYGRHESLEKDTAEFTNFYEFATSKDSWQYVGKFKPYPWKLEIGGLCSKPTTFDLDDIYQHRSLKFESRDYRHRCVETWAMCVPWTGFALRDLLKLVEPKQSAKFVRFETFNRPDEAVQMSVHSFGWPYTEGLTITEATNDLTFVATGIYGHPLPKQNGAPIRIVLPWKYGFKSIKSIVKIELTDEQPATFWNGHAPHEYGFEANVDPEVPHPRWSQRTEWMLGTRERFKTVKYNGYGKWVGEIYQDRA